MVMVYLEVNMIISMEVEVWEEVLMEEGEVMQIKMVLMEDLEAVEEVLGRLLVKYLLLIQGVVHHL
jgi:hypothetical protein